jgi:hypothetical protein
VTQKTASTTWPGCCSISLPCLRHGESNPLTVVDTTPSNAEIDADLALTIYDYDPRDSYPEFSHQDMREAWIAGYEAGRRTAQNADEASS